jgi:hypothetical protein
MHDPDRQLHEHEQAQQISQAELRRATPILGGAVNRPQDPIKRHPDGGGQNHKRHHHGHKFEKYENQIHGVSPFIQRASSGRFRVSPPDR